MLEADYRNMSPDELARAIAEFQRANAPVPPAHPDAPGCAGLSDAARETARTLYGASIMNAKDPLDANQIEFLRLSVLAALREL